VTKRLYRRYEMILQFPWSSDLNALRKSMLKTV